jgi:uncharacterized SAM-binding protein YcdF (DUF218 family)
MYQAVHPGQSLKILASTGRGRGAERLIGNTQSFFDRQNPEMAKRFQRLRQRQGDRLTEAKVIRFILEANGVPRSAIILEERSTYTESNMRESKQVIQEKILPELPNPSKPLKILIVTDGFHRLRALIAALDVFKGEGWLVSAPALYAPNLSRFKPQEMENYLGFLVGYPEGLAEPRLSGSNIGEAGKILKYHPHFPLGEWNPKRSAASSENTSRRKQD